MPKKKKVKKVKKTLKNKSPKKVKQSIKPLDKKKDLKRSTVFVNFCGFISDVIVLSFY